MQNCEKHPKWPEIRNKILDGAISYYHAAQELRVNRSSVWYAVNKKTSLTVPPEKIGVCRRLHCYNKFILYPGNKVDCDEHRRKSKIKYPLKRVNE